VFVTADIDIGAELALKNKKLFMLRGRKTQ
jgi:hypothetical protein